MQRKGFILTARDFDHKDNYTIELYVKNDLGKVERLLINNYLPVYFITSQVIIPEELQKLYKIRKETELKNFHFTKVDALYFSSLRNFYIFRQHAKEQGIALFESDIRPVDRFLMEKQIYGSVNYGYNQLNTDKNSAIYNPIIEPDDFHPVFTIASLDIETGQEGELYSVSFHLTSTDNKVNEGYAFIVNKETGLKKEEASFKEVQTIIYTYPDETSLLTDFFLKFSLSDPDFIIGWNIVNFDLNFLNEKCKSLNIRFALGRRKRELKLYKRNEKLYAEIPGRVEIEGSMSLRAAFYKFNDYSLEYVANELLGSGKAIAKQGNAKEKIAEIERMYKEDKFNLIKYNFIDCVLVTEIFKKTELIDLIINRIKISGMLFDKIGASAASFDYLLLPKMHQKKIVALDKDDVIFEGHAPGGYVFEPVTGMHENVAVLDFKSLYPTLMLTFKIDPLSYLFNDTNPLVTPAGIRMSRTEHILPEFISKALVARSKVKKSSPNMSMALKILMNSFYGVMGSPLCRFYSKDLATAITESGHKVLNKTKAFLELSGYQVIYGDTDSLFVKFEENTKKIEEITRQTNEFITSWIKTEFNLESALELEYEKLYSKLFLAKVRNSNSEENIGAKKRYVGLKEGKLDFVGMEYVRSDWTKFAKQIQYELYKKIFNNASFTELADWLTNVVIKLKKGFYNQDLVYEKRLKRATHNYHKNLPPHVRAARILQGKEEGRIKQIKYYMLISGPTPVEFVTEKDLLQKLDFEHYLDKQLKPVVDTVLKELYDYTLYEILFGKQLKLFN